MTGRASTVAYPDTLVGTDSHTTMVNGLGVLGWGVGGIEAEAAMLGQPISMLIPEVVGFKLTGELPKGRPATDLVLTVVEMLRAKGRRRQVRRVLRPRPRPLPLADRPRSPTWRPNTAPPAASSRSTSETLDYSPSPAASRGAGRPGRGLRQGARHVARRRRAPSPISPTRSSSISAVEPSLAGPKRPQDRVALSDAAPSVPRRASRAIPAQPQRNRIVRGVGSTGRLHLDDGDVVIAAITSCTNTSNPS